MRSTEMPAHAHTFWYFWCWAMWFNRQLVYICVFACIFCMCMYWPKAEWTTQMDDESIVCDWNEKKGKLNQSVFWFSVERFVFSAIRNICGTIKPLPFRIQFVFPSFCFSKNKLYYLLPKQEQISRIILVRAL